MPGRGRLAGPGTYETGSLACPPVPPPAQLVRQLPLPGQAAGRVQAARSAIRAVLAGTDDRLVVVAGPCAVHDPAAALDYARRLGALRDRHAADLLIVMRVYFDKPRTADGWKGLVNDPGLNGAYDIARGLRLTRQLLLDIAGVGLPAGCEWLNLLTPGYLADLVAWGAIGARTSESQVHRQLASALPMPVGFKNGTDGSVQAAVDGCRVAAAPHAFLGAGPDGRTARLTSAGNQHCHVVLRGGRNGPNFAAEDVGAALDLIAGAGLPRRVMVDASHGNSGKDHRRQPGVAGAIADQIAAGQDGLAGVMLESFLVPGRQAPADPACLAYGQSVTDACMDIGTTASVLEQLAGAVRARRSLSRRTVRAPSSRPRPRAGTLLAAR
ncbi:MAG: 3-deoxy-7-phosphoheptulonate synthase [Streptosporangiaceae bacterium]